MHILLTDLLVCPRCGPPRGLILLADRMEDRRVLEGRLGCANCRETYPVVGGALDLRTAPGAEPARPAAPEGVEEEGALRLAALMGLSEVRGTVGVAGPGAELASAIAALVTEVEVVALGPAPLPGPEAPGVSRVAAGGLPFRAGALRALALTGEGVGIPLEEAVRVLVPGGRLVVEHASGSRLEEAREHGAEVLLAQDGILVARVGGGPS